MVSAKVCKEILSEILSEILNIVGDNRIWCIITPINMLGFCPYVVTNQIWTVFYQQVVAFLLLRLYFKPCEISSFWKYPVAKYELFPRNLRPHMKLMLLTILSK